jgi:hypothetical protein
MFNIFSGIAHFFEALFGNNGAVAQKVLHSVSSFTSLAAPIVVEVENDLKSVELTNPSTKLAAVVGFLSKYEPDIEKVTTTANSLMGLSVDNLLHNAAVIALGTVVPGGTATASLLNLAVELAYNFFKSKTVPVAVPVIAPVVPIVPKAA